MTVCNSSEKLLVVDDSKSVRIFLSNLLGQAGYDILLAEDGSEAWNVLQHEKVDLIVSDLEMPKLDGFELCKKVKKHPDYKNIYFILLSTRDSTQMKVKGLETGADEYMGKNISESELLARIKAGVRIRALEKELAEKRMMIFQNEKMASIGQLAEGVAHEMNTPLSFISSNLNMLKEYVEKLTEYIFVLSKEIKPESIHGINEVKEKLDIDFIVQDGGEVIQESLEGTDRIANIVQILTESSNNDQSDCCLTDINKCIDDAIDVVKSEFKEKAAVITHYTPLPLTMCYRHPLSQVFTNLLVNGYQAIDENGEINIQTWSADNGIYISISDNGLGISQQDINRIFEPFFTTKEVGQGTGLGLSLVYDIIKNKHKGDVSVKSIPGDQTTFTILLPIRT